MIFGDKIFLSELLKTFTQSLFKQFRKDKGVAQIKTISEYNIVNMVREKERKATKLKSLNTKNQISNMSFI